MIDWLIDYTIIQAACELVTFCNDYKLPELQKVCVDKLRYSVDMDTVWPLLELAHLPNMPDLVSDAMKNIRPKCIKFILDNFLQMNMVPLMDER